MNTVVTSREQLLEAAKYLAAENGISSVSIRAVAERCRVSVGSIYNYFPTKSALLLAVVEDFWSGAFSEMHFKEQQYTGFTECFCFVFEQLSNYLNTFRTNWLTELATLKSQDKATGRKKEADYFGRLRQEFVDSLLRDNRIRAGIWGAQLSPEEFAEFALAHLLTLLRQESRECASFLCILERALYPD